MSRNFEGNNSYKAVVYIVLGKKMFLAVRELDEKGLFFSPL